MKRTVGHPAARAPGSAFTLIELLVVVAIIVALLAILLPSLNSALSVANTAVCASNLKQMGVAHLAYAADHTGTHPPASTDTSEPHWLELLTKYAGNMDEIRYCPETDRYEFDPNATSVPQRVGSRTQTWWLKQNTYGVGFYGGGSYGANIFAHSTAGWGSPIAKHFRSINDATRAHNIPLLADCVWHNSYPLDTNTAPAAEPNGSLAGSSLMGRYLIRRHHNAINVGFLDNSVRRVDLPDMWTLDWHKNFQTKSDVAIPYLND